MPSENLHQLREVAPVCTRAHLDRQWHGEPRLVTRAFHDGSNRPRRLDHPRRVNLEQELVVNLEHGRRERGVQLVE